MTHAYPFDLGDYSRPVSDNAQAQAWFDRGLIWLYGYNHEEAIACFKRALEHDDVAWAHWGIAYAIGPNYNKPWEVFTDAEKPSTLKLAHKHIGEGLALPGLGTLERDLLTVLATRYPDDPDIEEYDPWTDAFAAAMDKIHDDNPDDFEVTFIAAEALMNRTPWQLWDLVTGAPNPEGDALRAKALLDRALARPEAWDHPGLLHMYVHLMEMSPTPEAALQHGARLSQLCPDAGHLVHMRTHIDVLTGDYASVVRFNHAAAEVDDRYADYAGRENFYTLYRLHDLHFEIYGAMFLAQPSVALKAADRLRAEVSDEVVAVYPDVFETFVASRVHVYVRFGMWEEILAEDVPENAELYATTRALMFYARAVALANLGRDASPEVARFEAALAAIPDTRYLFQNKARDVLGVAEQMMLGEVAYKGGDTAKGLDHLRAAVALDDGLNYEEPWAWPQPTRHALGALLMDSGQYDEAEAVYRADLGLDPTLARALQNPGNVWALHGLDECLSRRGEKDERAQLKPQLDRTLESAEVPIRASCFCRQGA